MASRSSTKRKRTITADADGRGVGESGTQDRWTPPPPKPRTVVAPVTAVQGTPPGRGNPDHRKQPGMIGRRHGGGGGQRCCLACGGDGVSEPRARCSVCDGEYHPGCLDPPRAYAPKGRWVCGVCSESNCRDRERRSLPVSAKGKGGGATTTARGSPAIRKQQKEGEEEDEVAAEPRSRFADVASSALTRLYRLSDDGSGERRAPRAGGPVAGAGAGAGTGAAATHRALSSSVSQSLEKQGAAGMTGRVLAWALKSVGGSGEEGRTKQRGSVNGGKGGGDVPDVSLDTTQGANVDESRPSLPAAERRGEKRKRGRSNSKEREGVGSLSGVEGDVNGFSPDFWEDVAEPQEDIVTNDACENDDGGGDVRHNFGAYGGDSSARPGGVGGASVRSDSAPAGKGGERNSVPDARGSSFSSRSNAGVAVTDSSRARGGDGSGTFAATNGEMASSAAVVAPGSDSEEDEEGTRGRTRHGVWDKGENTRFLQLVAKHGDAWARLVHRQQDTGVMMVDESDRDDDEGNAGDDLGGAEPHEDGQLPAPAPAGGGEANEKLHNKRQDRGEMKKKEKGKKENQTRDLGPRRPSKLRKGLRWDEDEHERFVEGFERHGDSWAEVARVVRTRGEEQVARYALRWVDDKGNVRRKTNVKNTGPWGDDEHERFIEGLKKFGRSFEDVAIVVGTRSGDQAKKHSRAVQSKEYFRGVGENRSARRRQWDKEEHERFLEAVARHGRDWRAVAQAVGTRDNAQVCYHAAAVLKKDLSPKTAAPAPADPAEGGGGASAGNVIPRRPPATATATTTSARAAGPAPAPATSARAAAPARRTPASPRGQAAAGTVAEPNSPGAAAVATPVAEGGGGGGGGGGGADAADAGGPVRAGPAPSRVAVVENDSGDEDEDEDDSDGDGLDAPEPVSGETNSKRARPKETKQTQKQMQNAMGGESLGRTRLRKDLQWGWREHNRFVEGFERHGNSWAEVAKVVHTRSAEQVSRYALRWVDDKGRVRRRTNIDNVGRWDDEEHKRFLEGVKKFGRSFGDVAIVVGTRTLEQVKRHARASHVKQLVFRNKSLEGCRWKKEEHERFLEAVAKHGRNWVAVATDVGTRDRHQVLGHARVVLNKDLSPKVAASTPTNRAEQSAAAAAEQDSSSGGASAAQSPDGGEESLCEADEAESDGKDKSGSDARTLPPLDEQAEEEEQEEEEATKGGWCEEGRAGATRSTRPRPPLDAQDKRGEREKAREGSKKKRRRTRTREK
eukprot:g14517.t1